MRRARGPLFLKRGSYRKRRLRDAARMLPFVGLLLFMMPVLWAQDGAVREGTAADGMYLFFVWAVLLAVAAAMAPGLSSEMGADDDAGADGRGAGEG